MNDDLQPTWETFVDLGGRSAQRLGLPRSLGQVYAALYLSPRPLGLHDLMAQLHISKGNASMSVRQLADWGAVRRVWVRGDRRDFYEAVEDFGAILAHFLGTVLKPRLRSTAGQLESLASASRDHARHGSPDAVFVHRRISKIRSYQQRLGKLLPLAEKLL